MQINKQNNNKQKQPAIEQLKQIFGMLGKPDKDSMDSWVMNEHAKRWILRLENQATHDWSQYLSKFEWEKVFATSGGGGVSVAIGNKSTDDDSFDECIDLLSKLLKLNPNERINCFDAVNDRYFANIPQYLRGVDCKLYQTPQNISRFRKEFLSLMTLEDNNSNNSKNSTNSKVTKYEYQDMVHRKMKKYHKKIRLQEQTLQLQHSKQKQQQQEQRQQPNYDRDAKMRRKLAVIESYHKRHGVKQIYK